MNVQAIRFMAVLTAVGAFLLPSSTKQYEYLENGLDEIGQYCKLDSLVRAPGDAVIVTYNNPRRRDTRQPAARRTRSNPQYLKKIHLNLLS